MEPPGLLHRHCRVGLGRQAPFFLSLSVVIHGPAWQALDLGEQLVCSIEGWGLVGVAAIGVVHPSFPAGITPELLLPLWCSQDLEGELMISS